MDALSEREITFPLGQNKGQMERFRSSDLADLLKKAPAQRAGATTSEAFARLFQALRRFLDQAQIRVLFDIDFVFHEAKLVGDVDIAL